VRCLVLGNLDVILVVSSMCIREMGVEVRKTSECQWQCIATQIKVCAVWRKETRETIAG
jgi:hypothetical protein